MKKILATVILAASVLVGCGGGQAVAYRPISYGENNQCYYVNSPAEVIALQAQGLCQAGWAPTLMPLYWHQRYWNYYSSPSYYNVYVPASSRTVYVASERSWGSINKSSIATASKTATYQGSNGKTVTADKIGVAKYGGGSRFGPVGTKFGGGSGRVNTQSPSTPSVKAPSAPSSPSVKAPSSPSKSYGGSGRPSSGGTKSYGGGSSRPFSGGTKSYSGGSRSYGGGSGRR